MNEIGYHGTCSKYRSNIEEVGLDPDKCKYRTDHWLGQGVYFFDDYEKAMWWAKTTSSHNDNCPGRMPIFEDYKLRAVLFDYYKQQNKLSVIIGTFQKEFAGYTTKRSETDKMIQRKIMNNIGTKFKERQICVSKKECIKSTKLVYNEEEEVI